MKDFTRVANVVTRKLYFKDRLLTDVEFGLWCYMRSFCYQDRTTGKDNLCKRGPAAIATARGWKKGHARKVIKSLERKGLLRPVYQVYVPGKGYCQTYNIKEFNWMVANGGDPMSSHYEVFRKPRHDLVDGGREKRKPLLRRKV